VKITDITVKTFRTFADRFDVGHARPLPDTELVQTILTIHTDEGVEGHFLGGGSHGDAEGLNVVDQHIITTRLKALLVGQDPLDREMIWKWLWVANIQENVASVIDNALWDLAGRMAGLPVYKLMGGARDKVKAYASTYPNIGQPRVYAEHALACKNEGYVAYKIHPHYFWNPKTGTPTPGRPSNIKEDIETIHLVREAVGPDYVLMYDPWGTYMSLEEAIQVGRELEKLNYYWYEHPMPEYRVESYVRLSRELSIPILSPEIVAGGVFSRAEWILRGAGDMSRIDVVRGGITGARKTAIVAEAYGLRCEMHMAGWGNLQVCGATSEDTSEYYEKGLLAPGVDYDKKHPYLADICDRIDADGYVHLPKLPGMGYDIVWDYINDNLIDPASPPKKKEHW
jgi:L-alanine-DL-glutamate epimerase-like enolase superfamily enzyme